MHTQNPEEGAPTLTIESGCARIRFRRSSRHNVIEPADLRTLADHCNAIGATPEVRVAVIEADPPTFSSGFDIGHLGSQLLEYAADPFEAVSDAVERISVPTIAAIAGPIYGGAADIALACDFRVATSAVTLRIPAVQLGNHYYGGGLRRFCTRIGQAATARIFLAAEKLTAPQLLACGYLSEVVEQDHFENRIAELVARLSAGAPLATRGMKEVINAVAQGHYDREIAVRNHAQCMRSIDLEEGRTAFAQKRMPNFIGR